MAVQIPKLILDTTPYFRYEGEANATTQDQFQGFLKNQHSVLAVLTKNLWQATTTYAIGDTVNSPNMPKGFYAVAQTNGDSSANEPNWGDGSSLVSDGTVSWKLSKGEITVNGTSADNTGNIQIDRISKADNDGIGQNISLTYIKGFSVSGNTITFTKGDDTDTTLKLPNFKGANSTSAGSAGLVPAPDAGRNGYFLAGDGTWQLPANIVNITVTGSDLPERTANLTSTGGYDVNTSTGSGALTQILENNFYTKRGISAGTYTLQTLLQNIVNRVHYHYAVYRKRNYNCNCNCTCNCSDTDSGCVIQGSVITDRGYLNIKDIRVGDKVFNNGTYHNVIGIKKGILGKRKAITILGLNSLVLTDEHQILLKDNKIGIYNLDHYKNINNILTCESGLQCTYQRKSEYDILDIKNNNPIFKYNNSYVSFPVIELDYAEDTPTYTLVLEDCEWFECSGITIACAMEV